MTTIDDFLAHYGVKGMRWGVSRAKTPRASRRDRLEAAYRTKMSDVDAKTKADARIRTEKILITAGAIAVTAAVAVVAGKKLHTEFAPITLKAGSSLQNVNQHGKDLNLDKVTFATFKKSDNKIYREGFVKELLSRPGRPSNDVFATDLKAVKDIKIPSKSQTRKLFAEWEKSRGITPVTSKTVNINGVKRKVKLDVTTRMINNNRNGQISNNTLTPDSFLGYVAKKGFDGVQDVMDQRSSSYRAKAPLMFVNGATSLVVKGAEALKAADIFND